MIRWLYFLIIVAVGIALGPIVADYKGYILIAAGDWAVEMALVSFLLIVLAFMALGYLGFWLFSRSWRLMSLSGNWWGSRSSRKKQAAFTNAMIAIQTSHLNEAKTQLAKLAKDDFDGLPLLMSAQVAVKQAQLEEAQDIWQQARDDSPVYLAALLNLIRLDMEGQKYAAALEQITQLDEKSKSHPSVIRYHAQVLVELTKWDVLREQLKGWKKTLSAEEYTQLLSQSLQGEFTEVASKQGLQGLKQHWKSQKRNVRNDVTWQRIYIEQLMQMDHHDDAAAELLALQKKGPNDVLVPLFGQLKVSQPAQVKKCLESWIKASPESQSLYSILGGFAYHSKDWDLANKALSKAVDLSPTIGDFTVLAKVKERMQDQAGALYCYKSALQLKNT